MEKTEEQKEEKIKDGVMSILMIMTNKVLTADEYMKPLLIKAEKLTGEECEYYFDEYPYLFSIHKDDNGYVSLEKAIDEIKCENYDIYPEIIRVLISINNNDLVITLDVRDVEVKKIERE